MKRVFLIVFILSLTCGFLFANTTNNKVQEYDSNKSNDVNRGTKIVKGVVSMDGSPLQDVQVKAITENQVAGYTFTNSIGEYELYFNSSVNEVAVSIPNGTDYYGIYKTMSIDDNVVNNLPLNLIGCISNNNLMVGRVGHIEGFDNTQDAMTYLNEYLSENQNQNDDLYTFYCNTQQIELNNFDFSFLNLQNKLKVKFVSLVENLTAVDFNDLINLEISIQDMNFISDQINSAPLNILNSSHCTFKLDKILNAEISIERINNTKVDLTNSNFEETFPETPVRISLDDNNSNYNTITINNCAFMNTSSETTTPQEYDPPYGPGHSLTTEATCENQDFLASAVLMNGGNHTNNEFIFTNCDISYSYDGLCNEHGALLIIDAKNVQIDKNTFFKCGNFETFYMGQSFFPGSTLTLLNSIISFSFNKVIQNQSYITYPDGGGIIGLNGNSRLSSLNNTYYNNINRIIFRGSSLYSYSLIVSQNDIFYNQLNDNIDRIILSDETNYSNLQVDNALSFNFNINPLIINNNQNTITECDPLLDSDLKPIWTETFKSPAIDNATKHFTTNGIFIKQDDIGALEHTVPSMQNFRYLPGGQIHWISLPYLNKNNNSWHHVFHDWHENGLLEEQDELTKVKEIYTLGPDIENGFNPENPYGDYNPNLPLYSQYGFKVDLSNQNGVYLDYHGFDIENSLSPEMLVNTSQGQIHSRKLYIPSVPNDSEDPGYDYNDGNPARRIYLGYYKNYPMSISHAFGPLLEDISVIQSKNWFAVRDINTNAWVTGENYDGKILTLNPGEMIEVLYHGSEDAEFDWGQWTPIPPVEEPYIHDLATNFKFEEKKGYLPIIINIDLSQYSEIDKPVEVAILVDEVCKGAAVIKEDQVILNAYILSDIPEIEAGLKEISFELWLPQLKGNEKRKVKYELVNNSSQEVNYSTASLSSIGNYLQVNLSDTDTPNIPKILALYDNYPNPFNPETTISFDLPKDSEVKLEIYNIKGQKVKTLKNGLLQAGNHKLVWDGKNSNSDQVASGLYFYRLVTDKKKLTRKMILMK